MNYFMKARILIALLALLISGVLVCGSIEPLGTTIKPILSKTKATLKEATEQDGAHVYASGVIMEAAESTSTPLKQSIYTGSTSNKRSLNMSGGATLPGPQLHQGESEEGQFLDIMPRYTPGQAQPEVVSDLASSTIVYVGGSAVPLSSYQTTYGKYLWIESNGLRQYASIPQYSSLSLLAYTSTSGPGEILEMYPSASNQGTYQKTYYSFNPGYNRIPYRGDVAGRHYLLFIMDDQPSNAIIIDVGDARGTGEPVVLGTAQVSATPMPLAGTY
jgi:hypothetical protein